MKIKTSELIGAALDYAVTKCEGYPVDPKWWASWGAQCLWSTLWSDGGLIIEREEINLHVGIDGKWEAWIFDERDEQAGFSTGPTPLVAAMRCYVASKLGDEIEIPDEIKE